MLIGPKCPSWVLRVGFGVPAARLVRGNPGNAGCPVEGSGLGVIQAANRRLESSGMSSRTLNGAIVLTSPRPGLAPRDEAQPSFARRAASRTSDGVAP